LGLAGPRQIRRAQQYASRHAARLPEEMIRSLTEVITNPLPLETKLAMIAELDADGGAGKPEGT